MSSAFGAEIATVDPVLKIARETISRLRNELDTASHDIQTPLMPARTQSSASERRSLAEEDLLCTLANTGIQCAMGYTSQAPCNAADNCAWETTGCSVDPIYAEAQLSAAYTDALAGLTSLPTNATIDTLITDVSLAELMKITFACSYKTDALTCNAHSDCTWETGSCTLNEDAIENTWRNTCTGSPSPVTGESVTTLLSGSITVPALDYVVSEPGTGVDCAKYVVNTNANTDKIIAAVVTSVNGAAIESASYGSVSAAYNDIKSKAVSGSFCDYADFADSTCTKIVLLDSSTTYYLGVANSDTIPHTGSWTVTTCTSAEKANAAAASDGSRLLLDSALALLIGATLMLY